MNEFLIFHSSNNTPKATVERIRRKAKECADEKKVDVRVTAVDIDSRTIGNMRAVSRLA